MDTEDALGAPATRRDRVHREPCVWRDPVAWTVAGVRSDKQKELLTQKLAGATRDQLEANRKNRNGNGQGPGVFKV